jgi:hypothetical protein
MMAEQARPDRLVRDVVDAGFDEIALVQIGDESQPKFIAWAERELLPALRSVADRVAA